MKSSSHVLAHSDRALLLRILANQEDTLGLLQELSDSVESLTQKETSFMASIHDELVDLAAKVDANTSAVASAKDVLMTLKQKLDDAIAALPSTVDVTQLQALSDAIGANTDDLSAAVVANTPAEPPGP